MDMQEMNKGLCSLRLEKMSKVYNKKGEIDPTLLRATFSILDFSASGNKQIVSKKVGLECKDTLKYKPLVCKYIETTDYENPNDNFGDHDEVNIKLRNGEDYLATGTTPIGVCEDVYVGVIEDENENEVDVILGDFLLWKYRFPNEVSLINQFYENGETLYTSCEHYYKSSSKDDDGNEIVDSFILDGHCLLGDGIEPAYATSKLIAFNESWNKAINNIKKSINDKKEEVMEKNNAMFEYLKSTNAISLGDYRWKIYDALAKVMLASEYNSLYISNYSIFVDEKYFTYETYVEGEGYKYYKVTFEVDESENFVVDYEGKTEVAYCLVEVNTELENSLNAKTAEVETLTTKVGELETSLNAKTTELEGLVTEKESLNTKLNDSNEMVISLNSKVADLGNEIETMKPIVEEYNKEVFEKALNAAKETFKEKFEKVGAIDVFEEETTQELIKKSVNAKSDEFKNELNQLVVNSIKGTIKIEEEIEVGAKSVNSIIDAKKNKDLISNVSDKYEEMCGFKVN